VSFIIGYSQRIAKDLKVLRSKLFSLAHFDLLGPDVLMRVDVQERFHLLELLLKLKVLLLNLRDLLEVVLPRAISC
jgi:hypothetical protein